MHPRCNADENNQDLNNTLACVLISNADRVECIWENQISPTTTCCFCMAGKVVVTLFNCVVSSLVFLLLDTVKFTVRTNSVFDKLGLT